MISVRPDILITAGLKLSAQVICWEISKRVYYQNYALAPCRIFDISYENPITKIEVVRMEIQMVRGDGNRGKVGRDGEKLERLKRTECFEGTEVPLKTSEIVASC